ncbi:MAG: tetratricopeptide repeat protein [Alphaproteobacteria bacterium]|nr:tetratricopeptide repeat protein [Alphaproteobacteria bacterium]
MTRRAIPLLAAFVVATSPTFAAPKPAKAPAKIEAPVTVESLLIQARAAVTKGDTELAVRLAQSAIVADPARPTSYVALGDIYAEAGQPDYARNFYDQALGIDPAQPAALKAISALDKNHTSTTANAAR